MISEKEMDACPCGSGLDYGECCEPYIKGTKSPPTAEALMRSRYSAYVKCEISYIVSTCSPESKDEEKIDEKETRKWAESSTWQKLEVVSSDKGGAADSEGTVEFKAHFEQDGAKHIHHERASFEKVNDKWYYSAGKILIEQVRRAAPKVGRNAPCPCGSGKKYKHCCGR